MGYSHGNKWNDQKIEDDIKNVMRSYCNAIKFWQKTV